MENIMLFKHLFTINALRKHTESESWCKANKPNSVLFNGIGGGWKHMALLKMFDANNK